MNFPVFKQSLIQPLLKKHCSLMISTTFDQFQISTSSPIFVKNLLGYLLLPVSTECLLTILVFLISPLFVSSQYSEWPRTLTMDRGMVISLIPSTCLLLLKRSIILYYVFGLDGLYLNCVTLYLTSRIRPVGYRRFHFCKICHFPWWTSRFPTWSTTFTHYNYSIYTTLRDSVISKNSFKNIFAPFQYISFVRVNLSYHYI